MQGPFYEDMGDSSALSPEDVVAICQDKRNGRLVALDWNVPIEAIDRIRADHALAAKLVRPKHVRPRPDRKPKPKITVKVTVEVEAAASRRIDKALTRPKHKMRLPNPWDL